MRQVFMAIIDSCAEVLKIKPTKRALQSFVSHNGTNTMIVSENRFPEDAKVISVQHDFVRAVFYVVIESLEYPDVRAPTEITPVMTNFDSKKKEKVSFT
jgi:hypothetical protein